MIGQIHQRLKRQNRDAFFYLVSLFSRTDHPQVCQIKIMQSSLHGAGDLRRFVEFDLHPTPVLGQISALDFDHSEDI